MAAGVSVDDDAGDDVVVVGDDGDDVGPRALPLTRASRR
jgi:hypothetical protein